ncbi:tyrosine-type recombinase/integrase [Fructilactobacillus sp. Tb1]|uniref:tyrosine-type recombinase/integrase n=1 Tax=Fructilactobacillus sp. Tb1 TaxID=3422304 RepID=UPI003D2AB198
MARLKYSKRHASVFSYKTKKSTKFGYRITYYDSFHKRRESQKRGFDTEMNAYRASLNDQTYIAENNSDLVKNKNLTIKQFSEAFNKSRKNTLKESSFAQSEKILKLHIYPTIGNIKLNDLTRVLYIDRVINPLVEKNFTKATIRGVNLAFSVIMNAAIEDGFLDRNPIKRIKIPDTKIIKKRIMSKSELKQFNQQLEKESLLLQLIYYTLEQTGIRRGELCAITWGDIDFDNKKISINKTRDKYGIRSPKTINSYRTVYISENLTNLFKKYKIEMGKRLSHERIKLNDDTLVLYSRNNNPIHAEMVSTSLRVILKRAGLDYLIGHFTAHYFRHMYASFLLNSGVPVTEVSKSLGHASPDITLKIYSEANPDENINLAEKFNDLW